MKPPLPNPVGYQVYRGQVLQAPQLYDYVLAGNGVFKVAMGPHFSAEIPLWRGEVAGLSPYGDGGELYLHVPKIPASWLYRVLDHATGQGSRGAGELLRPVEQMYHFHWLPSPPTHLTLGEGGGWRVSLPKQAATPGAVNYRGGSETSIVLDLHSHHEMRAFFSATDDADEQGLRLYGVIGRIYTRPEIRLRVGVYGDWLELDPLEIFEGLGPFARRFYDVETD